MSDPGKKTTSRRTFMKNTGRAAAATGLAGVLVPRVHAAENNTIRIALVGCGGRGTGAAANAMSVGKGSVKLVAMADVFADRLQASHRQLEAQFAERMELPEDRRFTGFDAYRSAIDCLGPGDVVIFATPPAFRWVHFDYAIRKGVNVFMEKPVTVDGPTTRRMIELSEAADKKNLKVGVGLMWRHCVARRELVERVQQGEIGDVIAMRAYRMHGPIGSFASERKPDGMSDLEYQIRRFHSFLWASGGCYSDFYIHNIDELCWMKGAWPVEAQASGGRHYRGDYVDQNFDTYSIEYTFPDGAKLFFYGRCIPGCHNQFGGDAHGSKGLAVITSMNSAGGVCRTYEGQNPTDDKLIWRYPTREPNPYELEWEDLFRAIREDTPYNEARRGAESSLVSSMGRMAAHTGQVIRYDQILQCEHEFAPEVDRLTADSPAPLVADADGRYPVPMPGLVRDREY